ncbi:hypothetical protein [Butyrivibrio sp. JL13D10]|uniref:hypothetical protein n=1 Tax=Butyrivibrio sp. JL13D10 TaxID=3236815 RepID=UPI0038B6A12F
MLYGTVFFRSKEVFYDFQDYRKLEKSLQTIDQNETALDTEYTRLYNLAEQNRKDIIASWNARFAPNQQIGANGTYVTGSGTASIKGAIDSMPVHTFNEIGLSFANGAVNVSYPNPAWGYYKGGAIDTATINAQIAEAMKHTEKFIMNRSGGKVQDMQEVHKYRWVDASDIYQWGWDDGHVYGYNEGLAQGGMVNGHVYLDKYSNGTYTGQGNNSNWNDAASSTLQPGTYYFQYCTTNTEASTSVYLKVGDSVKVDLKAAELRGNNSTKPNNNWKSFQGAGNSGGAGVYEFKLTKATKVTYRVYCYDGSGLCSIKKVG